MRTTSQPPPKMTINQPPKILDSDTSQDGSLAPSQREIDNYRRLRDRRVSGPGSRWTLFSSLLAVSAIATALAFFGFIYYQQEQALSDLDSRVGQLAGANAVVAGIGDQLADLSQQLDSTKADVTRLWSLARDQQGHQLEALLQQSNDQQVLLNDLAIKVKDYDSLVNIQQKLRANTSSLGVGYQQLVEITDRLARQNSQFEASIGEIEGAIEVIEGAIEVIDDHRRRIARKLLQLEGQE